MSNAFDTQIGGDHYKKLKIQPMEYSLANGLDAAQHTVVKYVTRFRDKGGIVDLEKAKHVIDMLIETERKRQIEGLALKPANAVEPDPLAFYDPFAFPSGGTGGFWGGKR